jgi:hypothetical protein
VPHRLAVVVLALAALGCLPHEPRLEVVTEGSLFMRPPVPGTDYALGDVPFSVINHGDRTAFVPTCGQRINAAIDRLVGGRWEEATAVGCIYSHIEAPTQLRAGQRASSSMTFSQAGHYRLRVIYSDNSSLDNPRAALSQAFEVR